MILVTLFYVLPLGSAIVGGAGILTYLIYLNSEYYPSSRRGRRPRE